MGFFGGCGNDRMGSKVDAKLGGRIKGLERCTINQVGNEEEINKAGAVVSVMCVLFQLL